jgi:predicted esterase
VIDHRYFEGYDRLMRRWHQGIDETIIGELCRRCEGYPEAHFATHLDLILGLVELGDREDAHLLVAQLAEKGYWLDLDWLDDLLSIDAEVAGRLSKNRDLDPDDPEPTMSLKRADHPTERLAVVLHGWGQTPELMQYYVEETALKEAFDRLYLKSPHRLGSELHYWPEDGSTVSHLVDRIDKVVCEYQEVCFIGFGQGGALAMRLALSGGYPQGRFLAIAPTIPEVDGILPPSKTSLLVSGCEDPLHEAHDRWVEHLKGAGVPLAYRSIEEMGHHFPETMRELTEELL